MNNNSNLPTIIYLLQIIGTIVITIIVCDIYGIENNTESALKIAGLVIGYSIIITSGFFIIRKNMVLANSGSASTLLSFIYIVSIIFSIVFIGLIILVGYLHVS